MTAILRKLRRKRKLSSELDSRWGDISISSPNEGSWSQRDRRSLTASPVPAQSPEPNHGNHSRNISFDRQSNGSHARQSSHPDGLNNHVDTSPTIPTGYYDAGVRARHQKKSHLPPYDLQQVAPNEQTAVALPKAWEEGNFGDSSCDEAECDDVSALGIVRTKWRDENDYYRASKSPPLSVTSRMRRYSGHSTATDPTFSVPATASSKRTSFTSSVPGDPRLVRNSPYHDKGPTHRVNVQDPVAPQQELVPSYDDLYG